MATGWYEMSGTRKVTEYGTGPGPHYTDYTITFIGTEATDNLAAAMPIPGDLYTDVKGSGSLDTSVGTIVYDNEPCIIQVSESHKLTENRCMVTCRFRGYHVE